MDGIAKFCPKIIKIIYVPGDWSYNMQMKVIYKLQMTKTQIRKVVKGGLISERVAKMKTTFWD